MWRAACGAGLVGAVVVLGAARPALSAGPSADPAAACIRVQAEARYRALGYNHVVRVADVCPIAAECDVSTDVNPQPVHVAVPARSEIEVTTFLGSPARVFTPKVVCTMQAH